MEHEISSLGASVEVGNQGDQMLELPQPENVGAAKLVEPTTEECDQGDQMLELPPPQEEPKSREPKVPTSSKDQQVEVDEVKGSEVQTEEFNRECDACHHFFSSNIYRGSHVTRYHRSLLKQCDMCLRWFMFPWDFNNHLDLKHRKCEKCQQYLKDDILLWDHMENEHPTVMDMQGETDSHITMDPVTLDTSHQDHQVKCKYCDRYFKSIAECNMHVNRKHKKILCPECEKRFVKQADCDNHFRDFHKLKKLVCRVKGCSVYKYNIIELHEHMRYDHWSQIVFRCNKCIKVFSTRPELHQHHKVDHSRVKLADVQGEKYPCLRCHRQFLSKSMFVSHSRDHEENVYACNECLWHFNTIACLIKHCKDTYDDKHYACTMCREVFGNNPGLCRHTTSYHIKFCHICCRSFVSDDKLIDHMNNMHLGATVHSREEMIEHEQA